MKKTSKVLTLVASLALCAGFVGVGAYNLQADAETLTPDVYTHGGSVRKVDPTGLRFLSSVSSEYENAEIGTLIIPKIALGNQTLDHNTEGEELSYIDVEKTKWANDAVMQMDGFEYDADRFYFSAVVSPIPDEFIGEVMVARAYVKTDAGYVYGDPVERSIAQVAAAALQAGEQDVNGILLGYVDYALANKTLSMNVENSYMVAGNTQTLDVLNDNNYLATWTSSNENVATVDKNGKVTAVAEGNATITAKLGSQTFTSKVQVGGAIEGEKVFTVKANAGTSIKPENGNSTLEVLDNVTVFGQSVVKHTTTGGNYHTAAQISNMTAFKDYTTLEFRVYGYSSGGTPYGTEDHYVRIRAVAAGGTSNSTWSETLIPKGEWVTVTLDLTKIDLTKALYIQHGTTWFDTVDGKEGKQGWRGDYIYISDLYGVGKVESEEPQKDLLLGMKDAVASGVFTNDGTNASVSYSEEYGMAKITATNNWQAAGKITASIDVSAYSTITFKVFRPAGEGGYYFRVKSKNGSSYPLVNTDYSDPKDAGEWVEVSIEVSKLTNKNLLDMYIQFGTSDSSTGAQAEGTKGKYIYVSDIYGVK